MASATGISGKRVLIVEDDFLIAEQMRHAIEAAGGRVVGLVRDVEIACDVIDDGQLDVALLDVKLGQEDSQRVVAYLKERRVPFIVVSGYERSTLPRCYGNAPYYGKPVLEEDVLRGLATVLAERTSRFRL